MSTDPGVDVDRRTFLSSLAVATVAVACSSESDSEQNTGTAGDGATASTTIKRVELAQPAAAAGLSPGIFALGVASGDPLADRVMLWTRLASNPVVASGGSPAGDVEVAYDVATDEQFGDLVASGVAMATASTGHALHIDVTNLQPDGWYFYRFRAGDQTSAVGRTRTFPAADADAAQFRFVFASCQDLQWGHYGAWTHVANEEGLDAVVFLGDYIYETTLGDISVDMSGQRVWASPEPRTLEEYRWRYAQTKADPLLQAAHHAVPWLTTFDDHEVSNNYAGDVGQADGVQPLSGDRRLAAYQAWYEHTPIRITPEPENFDSLRVHRSLTFGSLASLFAIETRQNADPPPCRQPTTGAADVVAVLSDDGPDCPGREDPARTNLGAEQEEWLTSAFAQSESTWNILANPLMLAGLNVGTVEAPQYARDTWDGYPLVRKRLLDSIVAAEVSNPVVVTGDWHAGFVLDVKADPAGPTLMPEFVASSMTTVIFSEDHRAANPHVRYFAIEHGYGMVTVTPSELMCEFKYIADVWDPATPISSVDTWRVTAGDPVARQV